MKNERLPLTETRNPRTMFIDRLSTRDIVKTFVKEDSSIVTAVEAEADKIAQTVELCTASIKKGGRIIYIGAGTSGRLGILDASECPPTFGVSPDLVVGLIAGGEKAVTQAAEGAEDIIDDGPTDLKRIDFSEKDILIGITASGSTPYVVGALDYARSVGAKTALLTCNPYGKFTDVDVLINPAVGPEVITGSTRLKSGTACKMVLNILSSATMIKIGKVYQNLMVDMIASNNKLKKRAVRIVMEGAQVPNYEAEAALVEANGDAKVAIYIAKKSCDFQTAKSALECAGGVLYKALKESSYD